MKVVHDKNGLSIEQHGPKSQWTARQQITTGFVGAWRVYDEDGDEMFTLAPHHIPKEPNGVVNFTALESLIEFIIVQRTLSYRDGTAYGKTCLQNEVLEVLGVNDIIHELRQKLEEK